MSLLNKILYAINEGIKTSLLNFNDDNNVFGKSSNVETPYNTVDTILIKDTIENNDVFLYNKDKTNYVVDIIDGQIFIKFSQPYRGSTTHSGPEYEYIIIDVNNLHINISINFSTCYYIGTSDLYFFTIDYFLLELHKLINLPYCNKFKVGKMDLYYSGISNYKQPINIRFGYGELVLFKDALPTQINAYTPYADHNADIKTFNELTRITLKSLIFVGIGEDYENVGWVDEPKWVVKYFNSIGIQYVMYHSTNISFGNFVDNLYYQYDIPNLEEKIIEYGIIFDQAKYTRYTDTTLNIGKRKSIHDLMLNDNKKFKEKLRDIIEKNDKSIKSIHKIITDRIAIFANYMFCLKIPFYKNYIKDAINVYPLQSCYYIKDINIVRPLLIIEPLIFYADLLGYTTNEILDMTEIACRFMQKNGNRYAYEFSENHTKKGRK